MGGGFRAVGGLHEHHAPCLTSLCLSQSPLQVTLAANHDKMESEVNGLRSQLATEKSRYQKMQTDLQKELNVAFDENTKLTTLLDGKVPKSKLLVTVWILRAPNLISTVCL